MLLYKYTTAKDAIKILKNHSLRFSKYNSLNTPLESFIPIENVFNEKFFISKLGPSYFNSTKIENDFDSMINQFIKEFCAQPKASYTEKQLLLLIEAKKKVFLGEGKTMADWVIDYTQQNIPTILQVHKDDIADEMANKYAALCLTTKPDDEVMWSHYASGHSGVVLGFDTNHPFFELMFPIDYNDQKTRRKIDANHDIASNELINPMLKIREMMGIKNECWKYENEVRVISTIDDLTDTGNTDERHFPVLVKQFPPECLKEIIFGSRIIHTEFVEIFYLYKSEPYCDVRMYGANPDRELNKIVVEEIIPKDNPGRVNT